MKILYLIDTLEIGGAEKSLLEIVSHFRDTQAVMCHIYPGEALKTAYQKTGTLVRSLNVGGRYAFQNAARQVAAVVQSEQPNLLHTTLFRADLIGRYVGHRLHIPVISSFVNEPYSALRQRALSLNGRLKLRCVQAVDAWSAHWCEHFTANSVTIKQANARALSIPRHKISVIHRGRNPAPFLQANPQQVEQTRKELRLSVHHRVVLNVGRLLQRKGQAELIRAMPTILQQNPDVRLLIAGAGDYHTQLKALITEMGLNDAVQLLGQRQDIPALLHLADVFVFPSHYEGYPGALVEAMLAACPIVASDIPVHREAIEPDQTGCLCALQDVDAITQAVTWVLDHPQEAKAMGVRAQQDALSRFHIAQIAAQHEQLYENVLEAWRTKQ